MTTTDHEPDETVFHVVIFPCEICGQILSFKGKDYCACDGVEWYQVLKEINNE